MKSSTHLLLLLLGMCYISEQGMVILSVLLVHCQVAGMTDQDYDVIYVTARPDKKQDYDYNADDTDADADGDDFEEIPRAIVSSPQHFEVEIGATIKLPCQVDRPEDVVVQWTKGVQPLFLGNLKQMVEMRYSLDTKDYTLTITKAAVTDSSKFSCQLIGEEGNPSVTHEVVVKSTPTITRTVPEARPEGNEEKEGVPLTFMCEAAGVPPPKIYWIRHNNVDEPKKVDASEIHYDKLTWKHSGNYTCFAENNQASTRKMIRLFVRASPDVHVPLSKVNSAEKFESELICKVHCSGCTDIHWEKDGKPIVPDSRHSVLSEGENHILRISGTKKHDFGEYHCIASNKYGTASKSVHLKAEPLKPLFDSQSTGANNNPSITWKIQSKAEIEEYEIIYKKQEEDAFKSVKIEPGKDNSVNGIYTLTYEFNIPQDQPGTYVAKLRAKNKFGLSELSDERVFPGGGGDHGGATQSDMLESVEKGAASHIELRISILFIFSLLTAHYLH